MSFPFNFPPQRTSASSFLDDHRRDLLWSPQGVPVEDPITAWNAAMQTLLVNAEGHHSNNYASSARITQMPPPSPRTGIYNMQPATPDESPTENERRWHYFYEALVEFKEEFGHTRVPLPYKTKDRVALGAWVSRQKYQYRNMKKGLHNCMYPDRLWKLNEIGFDWRGGRANLYSNPPVTNTSEESAGQAIMGCSDSYAQIAGSGHSVICRSKVAENKTRQSELDRTYLLDSNWALPKAENKTAPVLATKSKQQRKQGFFGDAFFSAETAIEDRSTKPNTMEGALVTKALEARRRAVTDSSGFPPQVSPVTAASSSSEALATSCSTTNEIKSFAARNANQDTWMSQYQDLNKYKEQKGHTRVPRRFVTKEGFPLGAWVKRQRGENGKRQRGQPNTMYADRLRMLNDIGFEWGGGGRGRREDKWDSKFKALVEFKEQFGHTRVPKSFVTKDGVLLGSWAMNQRTEYRKRAKGLKNYLYPERLRKLHEIEFDCDGRRVRCAPEVKTKEITFFDI